VPVLLHGLSDDYGRVTSEQVLSEYGLPPCDSVQEAQQRIDRQWPRLPAAGTLSPGLASQLALRDRLGLRNSAHSLVKMLDPFHGDSLLLAAATHPDYIDSMRAVLRIVGAQRAAAARHRRRAIRQSEASAGDRACA
jgi:anthranilate phosphoribosyltransferase